MRASGGAVPQRSRTKFLKKSKLQNELSADVESKRAVSSQFLLPSEVRTLKPVRQQLYVKALNVQANALTGIPTTQTQKSASTFRGT